MAGTARARVRGPSRTDAGGGARARRPRPRWLPGTVSVLVGTGLIAASGSLYGRWIVDDAAITFDFARNVALGYGPVAQPGGPLVEGYSDPTWLALLVLGNKLGLMGHGTLFGVPEYVLYPKALALACCAGILVLVHVAAREVSRRPWVATLLAGGVLAGISSFVIWSFSGLENALYALVVTGLAVLLLRAAWHRTLLRTGTAVAAGVLVVLAALTRPDGLVYVAAYPVLVLLAMRRGTRRRCAGAIGIGLASFAVPYAAFLALRLHVFGRLLPLTAVAKNQSVPSLTELGKVGELFSYAGWLLVGAAAVTTGVALARGRAARRLLAAPLVVLLLALLAFGILNGDWMPWYRFATPVWPLATLLVLLAGPEARAVLDRRAAAVLGVLLAGGMALSGAQQYATARSFRADPTVPVCAVVARSGRGFNGLAGVLGDPGATLLTPDLGGSSLTSSLRLVDLAGLASPRIAEFWGNRDLTGLRRYVFGTLRPTFVWLSPGWATGTGLLADPRMRRDYYPLDPTGYAPGAFVRKDAVGSPARLAALRGYERDVVVPAVRRRQQAPRGSCGPLATGQTPGR